MALVCALVAWVMPAAAQEAAPAAPIDEAPKREQAVIGEESEALEILKAVYKPVLSFELGRMTLDFPLSIAERVETVSGFDVDADGTRFEADPTFNTQLRAGARLDSQRALSPVRLSVNVEVDIFTGQHQGGSELDGVFVPDGGELDTVVRKANGQLDFGPFVHVAGGLMTSHWGMGLVANDGAHGWEHGTAFFVDPRDGDLVLRGMMALGPFWDDGLVLAFGMDRVQSDDIMLEGDQAFQVFASAIYGQNAPAGFGFYAVSRNQDATDGDSLDVVALDFTAHGRWGLSGGSWLKLETELAVITGTTTLAPSPDFPEHDVSQFAWAGRATVGFDHGGAVLDVLFASGDDNFSDRTQSGFRVDRNYPMGLIMHRYVLAAQTARAPVTASDPELVGLPSEDLDRFPTQQAITNTLAIFPRGWWSPLPQLEIFGGPLIAFAPKGVADPLRSRVSGGQARNALGGDPGGYLGTELDVGMRYRRLMAGSELTLGLEGGMFLPGEAFNNAQNQTLDTVYAGRATVQYRF